METFLFYFTHLGIPALILVNAIFRRPSSWLGTLSESLFAVAFLWFFYLWGQWPIVLSMYFKYVLLLLILFQVAIVLIRIRNINRIFPRGWLRMVKNTILLIIGVLFAYLVVRSYQGRYYQEPAVVLDFPLKDGDYYIASGGSNQVLNNHYNRGSRTQRYALDINKMGAYGKIHEGMGSAPNNKHYIFGTPVYAPCDGVVIELENQVADNQGTNLDVAREQGQGNFIVLDCQGTVITMVHLKEGSIEVNLGDQVVTGTALGQVGNSGFSQEPHLHFQAARLSMDSTMVGIPLEFNGFRPYRNVIIRR